MHPVYHPDPSSDPQLERALRVVAPDANEKTANATRTPAGVTVKTTGLILEMANVLYDATLWWRWLRALLARLGVEQNQETLRQLWNGHLVEVRCGRREFGEAFEAFLWSAGLASGEVDEVLASGLAQRRNLEFDALPFPRVKRTLRRLQQAGLRLAILTDSTSHLSELNDRIQRLGLDGLFDAVVSSVEIGVTKPQPASYSAAVCRLGLPLEELWFVSQSDTDLAGAAAAGLRTIAFNSHQNTVADRYLSRFDGLCELVTSSKVFCASTGST